MPPEPGPKGGGVGRVFEFLLRAPGGFVSHAADRAAVQAQVGQVAVRQVVQLAQGLAIQGPAGHVVTDIGHEGRDRAVTGGIAVRTAMDQIENSHFIHSFVLRMARRRFACFRFAAVLCCAVGANMARLLRLHNGRWRHAAMQKRHGCFGEPVANG